MSPYHAVVDDVGVERRQVQRGHVAKSWRTTTPTIDPR